MKAKKYKVKQKTLDTTPKGSGWNSSTILCGRRVKTTALRDPYARANSTGERKFPNKFRLLGYSDGMAILLYHKYLPLLLTTNRYNVHVHHVIQVSEGGLSERYDKAHQQTS